MTKFWLFLRTPGGWRAASRREAKGNPGSSRARRGQRLLSLAPTNKPTKTTREPSTPPITAMALPGMPTRNSPLSGPSPIPLGHQNTSSFRTTLDDDFHQDESDDESGIDNSEESCEPDTAVVFNDETCITVERQSVHLEGASPPGSPRNTVPDTKLGPASGEGANLLDDVQEDYFGALFTSLGESTDTELVDATADPLIEPPPPQHSQEKPKRRFSAISNPLPSINFPPGVVKRARISTPNRNTQTEADSSGDNVSNDWDWVVLSELGHNVPAYGPSDIMTARQQQQQRQQRSTRRVIIEAVAIQAKAATKTMGRLRRGCRTVVGRSLPGRYRGDGPTKCVAVGGAC